MGHIWGTLEGAACQPVTRAAVRGPASGPAASLDRWLSHALQEFLSDSGQDLRAVQSLPKQIPRKCGHHHRDHQGPAHGEERLQVVEIKDSRERRQERDSHAEFKLQVKRDGSEVPLPYRLGGEGDPKVAVPLLLHPLWIVMELIEYLGLYPIP